MSSLKNTTYQFMWVLYYKFSFKNLLKLHEKKLINSRNFLCCRLIIYQKPQIEKRFKGKFEDGQEQFNGKLQKTYDNLVTEIC